MTLNIYEITFSLDDVLSCTEVKQPPDFDGDISYCTTGRYLTSALIRTDTEEHARTIGKDLIDAYARQY